MAHVGTLLDVSLICFVVSLLSQLKHILGLANQRAHISTFECVRLCSEGKIIQMQQARNIDRKQRARQTLQQDKMNVSETRTLPKHQGKVRENRGSNFQM